MRNLTDQEIKENNIKIATFMGGEYKMSIYQDMLWMFPIGNPVYNMFHGVSNTPYFDKSWDALMPVIQQISKTGCIVDIWFSLAAGCRIVKINKTGVQSEMFMSESNDPKEAVYEAIIQFIDNYNAKRNP